MSKGDPKFSEDLPYMEGIPSFSKEKHASSVLEEMKNEMKNHAFLICFFQKVLENLKKIFWHLRQRKYDIILS